MQAVELQRTIVSRRIDDQLRAAAQRRLASQARRTGLLRVRRDGSILTIFRAVSSWLTTRSGASGDGGTLAKA